MSLQTTQTSDTSSLTQTLPQVQGYTKFYQAGKYRAAIPAVKEVNTSDIYISHIDSSAQWWTGVSLVNTTSATKELTITFNDGQSRNITLTANQHRAFTIRELFNNQPQPSIKSAVIANASGVIGLELFGTNDGKQLEGIPLTDKTASTLYYPHVDSNGWWTGIVAYNPSSSGCTITITPYSAQGTPLSPINRDLTGKETYVGVVSELGLPAQTAWFRIDATSPITGFELFGTADGNQLAAYAGGNGAGAKSGVFAKIEKNGWTGIAFVNTEADAASVTLTAYNDSGSCGGHPGAPRRRPCQGSQSRGGDLLAGHQRRHLHRLFVGQECRGVSAQRHFRRHDARRAACAWRNQLILKNILIGWLKVCE